jgi:signal-transduction protein with cAMP-binding, CBS, and nucleotidyltransferase domain
MTKQERLKLMSEVQFFKNLNDLERDRLADSEDNFQSFSEGDYIIQQGEIETPIYIMLKGKAIVTRNQNPNSELAKLKYGSVFGTVSLAENALRQTNVVAQNDVLVFRIEEGLIESFDEETRKMFSLLRRHVLVERLEKLTLVIADLKAEIELLAVEGGEEGGEEDVEFNWDL